MLIETLGSSRITSKTRSNNK